MSWSRDLSQDLRGGIRLLLRRPVFTLVAILSLTLGIGVNTTVFTLVKAVFLQPVPAADPSRAVEIFTRDARNASFGYLQSSYINLRDLSDKSDVFSQFSAMAFSGDNWLHQGHTEPLNVQLVGASFFPLLGENIAPGRNFSPDEDGAPGAHPVAIVSHTLWLKELGGQASAIGSAMNLNGLDYTIIGVAPAAFDAPGPFSGSDVYVPLAMHDQILTGIVKGWFLQRRPLFASAVARLKPGVTIRQAELEMHALATQLARQYPTDDAGRDAVLVPLSESNINPNARPLFLLAGTLLAVIAGLVLLIACANVANLLLVRATQRRRELAVRQSLGAGRGRLVRQLLTESLLLGLLAGGAAVGFAYLARNALWALRPAGFGQGLNITLDARVLAFTFLVALLATALVGLFPALRATRAQSMVALRDRTDPPSGGLRWYGLRGILVMIQVAFSLIALVGASLFVHSLMNVQQTATGMDMDHLVAINPRLQAAAYPTAKAEQFYRDAIARLQTLPQVAAASVSDTLPLTGGFQRTTFPGGVDVNDTRNGKLTPVTAVRPGYFQTLGVPLLRGRDISPDDSPTAPLVAVINDTLANRLWPGQDPLGKHLRFLQETWDVTVVGEVPTVKYATLGEPPQAQVYFSLDQQFGPAQILVRTRGNPSTVLPSLRAAVQGIDPALQPVRTRLMSDVMAQQLEAPRLGAELLAVFGILALLLAAVGTYGVMSYSVSQRVREIGLRVALGAGPGDVLRLILGSGMAMVLAGTVLGLAVAALLGRGVATLLYGIGGLDLPSFGAASGLLLAIALFACWLPARRALRVDPNVALRDE